MRLEEDFTHYIQNRLEAVEILKLQNSHRIAFFRRDAPNFRDNPADFDASAVEFAGVDFAAHAGDSRVYLNQDGEWKRIAKKISDSSDLRGELKTLLGAENVRLY